MTVHTKINEFIQEVDVVVAGGGTAGCVVAARLAQADPALSILVIERGQNNADMPTISTPAWFLAHLAPDSTSNIFYKSNKSAALADRELVVPSGGILGGGSSTNFMMYSRAQRYDFDSWKTPGWTADEMLPYLKKLETYTGPDEKKVHGDKGPIQVSRGTYSAPRVESEFAESASKLGWPLVDDLSDLETVNAIWRAQRYISPDGKRQDAATCYLHPAREQSQNLHVLVETQVTRVLFDKAHKANGVEVVPNPLFHRDGDGEGDASTTTHKAAVGGQTIRARKLVVAACGAIATPGLLERSGVGDADVLRRAGVPLVADLPGVGHGYEDHQLLLYAYRSGLAKEDTLDALYYGKPESLSDETKGRMMGWNAQDIQGKIRPTDDEAAALGPAFQAAWQRDYQPFPEKPMALFSLVGGFPGDPRQATGEPCLALSAFTVYPYSRGHVHITGPKLGDPLDFATGYFEKEGALDVQKHVWLYKKQRELMRRMPSYRGEIAGTHPPFPAGSPAACQAVENPGPLASNGGSMPDIAYSAEDDAVLERWIRENISTTWHSLGTCKMLPRDGDGDGDGARGVVDASLSVYGVSGLKIADMSIVPGNVAANTNNTALAIGEKAADIFIRELGLGK